MARRGYWNGLPVELERALAVAREGALAEAEVALNRICVDNRLADPSVLEKIESIRGLRQILDSPGKLNGYPGGSQFARVQLLADLQSLRRRLLELRRDKK